MDLSVRIGSLTLKNPLIAASGCFGYGVEYADVVDLSTLGAIVSKGLFLKPREGHPAPRIVRSDGTLEPLDAHGLVLGIERGQSYEEVHGRLATGDAVVLYTDGVLEARRNGELYGFERLDAALAAGAGRAPETVARAVLDDCRAFAQGELADDCAIVVVRRV